MEIDKNWLKRSRKKLFKSDRIIKHFPGLKPERLDEYAKIKQAPHYMIDGEGPFYSYEEIVPWIENNLVHWCSGEELDRDFCVVVPAPKPIELPPNSIRNLSTLGQIPLPNCDYTPGIYFLCLGDDVVYIGQSINPLSRVCSHMKVKEFDRAYILPIPESDLSDVESAFIELLNPSQQGHYANGKPYISKQQYDSTVITKYCKNIDISQLKRCG